MVDELYTSVATYRDQEWGAKELHNAACNIVKATSRRFKIEMKEVRYFSNVVKLQYKFVIYFEYFCHCSATAKLATSFDIFKSYLR